MFFSEFEDHVDGGVLANNPCQVSLCVFVCVCVSVCVCVCVCECVCVSV